VRRPGEPHVTAVARLERQVLERARRHRSDHLATAPSVTRALTAVGGREMWARRPAHGDAMVVSVGLGSVRRPITVSEDARSDAGPGAGVAAVVARAEVLGDVPVVVDLGAHCVVGVAGAGAPGVVRGMVAQLAVLTGPADWCLALSGATGAAWSDDLPHRVDPAGVDPARVDPAGVDRARVDPAGLVDRWARAAAGRHLVVVVEDPAELAAAGTPIRRLLATRPATTVLLVAASADELPAICSATLTEGARGRWHWHDPSTAWPDVVVHPAGLGEDRAARLARTLARYGDPELLSGGRGSASGPLSDLLADGAAGTAARWSASPRDVASLRVPIGRTSDGVSTVDLVADGPHALVAGTTGSGKSELLRSWVVALASAWAPTEVAFVLVDFKGGATFDGLARLPHVAGVVTDLDGGAAGRLLRSLDAELVHREAILRRHGVADLAHLTVGDVGVPPRLVVVVDELAALVDRHHDATPSLVAIAQRGRSLGVHLVLATQRPAGVVSDAVRANVAVRIALRVESVTDAVDVVGDADPAGWARSEPGRARLRVGHGAAIDLMVATVGDSEPWVTSALDAARRLGLAAVRPVCAPPLPRDLRVADPEVVGVVDEVAAQAQPPLRWHRRSNLALVGAVGTGTTSAMARVLASVPADHDQIVVQTGAGASRACWPAGALCVSVRDHERVLRVVRRLLERCETRIGSPIVLAVDDLGAVRHALDTGPDPALAQGLERVLVAGPAAGVHVVATVRPASARLVASWFGERWVFHLDDPSDGPGLGVPAGRVPARIPGRVVVAGTGLDAQVALVESSIRHADATHPVIDVLPALVATTALDEPSLVRGLTRVAVGLDFDGLAPLLAELVPGEHWLVVGPPRSGRSSALGLLATSWATVHGSGSVQIVCGRAGSPLADHPARVADLAAAVGSAAPGDLVVVDDAERVEASVRDVVALTDRGVLVVASCGATALRGAYDHWLHAVRRSGTGIVLAGSPAGTGDLLDADLPRRAPIDARPGLAWIVTPTAPATLVQLARPGGLDHVSAHPRGTGTGTGTGTDTGTATATGTDTAMEWETGAMRRDDRAMTP
jgi:DNA segregation ATPase FtsK/SpoIIIE, S-DNA-T family